jgi:hypothetical protein
MSSGSFLSAFMISSRTRLRVQQLVQFGVDGFRVGALDKKRHEPDRKGGNTVPIERLRLKHKPENSIGRDNHEGGGDSLSIVAGGTCETCPPQPEH